MVYLNDDLGQVLSSSEKELITSITSGGAFVGAIAAGLTADRFGRKGAIYMGCVLFIIGAVLQACAYSLAQMTVGRLVVGFGVGSAAMIVPVSYSNSRKLQRPFVLTTNSFTSPKLHLQSTAAG